MSLGLDREKRIAELTDHVKTYRDACREFAELNGKYVKACIKLREQRNFYVESYLNIDAVDNKYLNQQIKEEIKKLDAEVDLIFNPPKEPN